MPNDLFPDCGLSRTDNSKLMLKHWYSLSDLDRAKARSAATTVATCTQIGTSIGLVVGWILARRSRGSALKIANAFKPTEQPIAVVIPDGRAEAIAIISDTLKPSKFRNIATHIFYISGASILGAAYGGLTGFGFAGRKLREDKKSMARMALALNRYKVEVSRKQADNLERMLNDSDSTESILSVLGSILFGHLIQQCLCCFITSRSLLKVSSSKMFIDVTDLRDQARQDVKRGKIDSATPPLPSHATPALTLPSLA